MATDDKRTAGEAEVLKAIDAMIEPDRDLGHRMHKIIMTSAPELMPRTWYGMPAYSNGDKLICFFRSRTKFGEHFMTLGFNDAAKLDDGNMWPIYFAFTDLTDAEEANVAALVKKAVGSNA